MTWTNLQDCADRYEQESRALDAAAAALSDEMQADQIRRTAALLKSSAIALRNLTEAEAEAFLRLMQIELG